MSNTTLDAIRNKVRRITRNPSEQQLTTAQLDDYINTFYLYDFPNSVKTRKLLTNNTQITFPYVDYITIDENLTVNVKNPVFVNGNQVYLSQNQAEFFAIYPQTQFAFQIAVGDGVTTVFASGIGGLVPISQAPFLISSYSTVLIASVDINNQPLNATDDVANRVDYTLTPLIGTVIAPSVINYLDGQYVVTFATAPKLGEPIWARTQPVTYGIPDTVLYFDGKLYMRHVTNTPLNITWQQDGTPDELLGIAQSPPLKQWFQYIAYGAAKKIFEDRMNLESVALIMPEFKKQEVFVMSRVCEQLSQGRTATIYNSPAALSTDFWPFTY